MWTQRDLRILRLIPVAMLLVAFPGRAAGAPPEGATQAEIKGLEQIASEIRGWILYCRPPRRQNNERTWITEKIAIGEWKPIVISSGDYARWSPDGAKIAVSERGSVEVMNADGSGRKKLCQGATGFGGRYRNCPIDFHPDGKRIIFIRAGGGVSTVDIETAVVSDMELPGNYTAEPQMSADGAWLVARFQIRGGTWAEERRMVIVDLTNNIERTYGGGCAAALSPDGNWMTVNDGGHQQMMVWNRDLRHRLELDSRTMVLPHRSWDGFHWSNHNDYFVVKTDAHWTAEHAEPGTERYRGAEDAFLIQLSEKHASRVTFGSDCDYPDLFVTRDLKRGEDAKPGKPLGETIAWEKVNAEEGDPMAMFRPPDNTKTAQVTVVATLVRTTDLPKENKLKGLEYANYLVEYVYKVNRLLIGDVKSDHIIVAHWAIRNRKPLADIKAYEMGEAYMLLIEPFPLHEELKKEGRFPADPGKIDLKWPVFYDVSPKPSRIPRPPPPPPPAAPEQPPPPPPKPPDAGEAIGVDL